MKLQL